MGLTSLKIFLCRNDIKIVIICTITGGLLQVLAKKYLKSHPEFLERETKKNIDNPDFFLLAVEL